MAIAPRPNKIEALGRDPKGDRFHRKLLGGKKLKQKKREGKTEKREHDRSSRGGGPKGARDRTFLVFSFDRGIAL